MVTIGQILKRERIRKKLTLEDVEKTLKIKANFLEAVEKGEYSRLPSSAYAQGFVLSYAQFLGIAKKEAAALFRRDFDEKRVYKVLPKSMTNNEEFSVKRRYISFSVVAVVGIIAVVVLYLFFQYRAAFFSPPLSVASPTENAALSNQSVTVSGTTDANAMINVNNSDVAVDDNGNFKTAITLFPGSQTITITAKNKFGKVTTLLRHVTVTSQ